MDHRMKYSLMKKVKMIVILMMSKSMKNVPQINIRDIPFSHDAEEEHEGEKFIFNLAVPLMKISSKI